MSTIVPMPGLWILAMLTTSETRAQDMGDCGSGMFICSDTTISGAWMSTGDTADLNTSNFGCLIAAEQQGAWLRFSVLTGGHVAFSIEPDIATLDFDFAVWGPYAQPACPPPDAPVRCSYASLPSQTSSIIGLHSGAGDVAEGALGDGWLDRLDVSDGEQYLLFVDDYSQAGSGFHLNMTLTGGASLNCTPMISTGIADGAGTGLPRVALMNGMITVSNAGGAPMDIRFIDALGRQLATARGTQHFELDVRDLSPDKYLVEVLSNGARTVKSLAIGL